MQLTTSTPAHIFTHYMCLLDTRGRICARLILQCRAEVVDAVLSQHRVHAALQGVALPPEEVVSVLPVAGAVQYAALVSGRTRVDR